MTVWSRHGGDAASRAGVVGKSTFAIGFVPERGHSGHTIRATVANTTTELKNQPI